jgi:hypothetical protein
LLPDSQHAGAFDLVVLEHLERHVRLTESERHCACTDRDLTGELQEFLAVGARVRGDAAQFFFVEEMLFAGSSYLIQNQYDAHDPAPAYQRISDTRDFFWYHFQRERRSSL